jgi:hypothetical protein
MTMKIDFPPNPVPTARGYSMRVDQHDVTRGTVSNEYCNPRPYANSHK